MYRSTAGRSRTTASRWTRHRHEHLGLGKCLIEVVREEMGDADSSQVDCGDGGRRGLQHL